MDTDTENTNEAGVKTRKQRAQGANLIKISFSKLEKLVEGQGTILVSKKWVQDAVVKKALADLESEFEDEEILDEEAVEGKEKTSPAPSVALKEFDFNSPDDAEQG